MDHGEGIRPILIAHRGYSAIAPENTLPAFDAAIEAGADALEFDLQETVEGIPVVFHDYDLERTTDGRGWIGETTLAALEVLDAGSWFAPAFSGTRVPTLEEALDHLRSRIGDRTLYIEVKAGLSRRAVRETLRLVNGSGLADQSTLISFDWWALHLVRKIAPDQRIGFLVNTPAEFYGALLRATEAGRALVDCNYSILLDDPTKAARAHELGIELAVYTVDRPEDAVQLAELGVGGVTTNEVARLRGGG